MANKRGGKRAGAGRHPTDTVLLRVSIHKSTWDKLERFAKARGPVAPNRLTVEIAATLNRLLAAVETPEDFLPAYMRLIRS